MRKLVFGALAVAIFSATIGGVATTTLIKNNNVVYSKDYAHKNVVDMNNVVSIEKSGKGFVIKTTTDEYYWEE